jgi:hypothetical protein
MAAGDDIDCRKIDQGIEQAKIAFAWHEKKSIHAVVREHFKQGVA